MLREKLCSAQVGNDWPPDVQVVVADLINLIDVHRPLGPDGKHDDRHTPTCGCGDRPQHPCGDWPAPCNCNNPDTHDRDLL